MESWISGVALFASENEQQFWEPAVTNSQVVPTLLIESTLLELHGVKSLGQYLLLTFDLRVYSSLYSITAVTGVKLRENWKQKSGDVFFFSSFPEF